MPEYPRLLAHPRFEILPTPSALDLVTAHVPTDVVVTVTSSPSKGLEATIDLTERLAARGYSVVPHLAARQVVDAQHLAEVVARLTSAGVGDVFVPAGDNAAPAGEYEGAYELLAALEDMGRPFAQLGVTGYPESHREISDDVTIQAMWDKRRVASYLVSNLCFNPHVLRRWVKRVRSRRVTLPLYLGLAGPVDQAKLVKVATKIGVDDTARFVSGHWRSALRLSTPGAYNPTRLLARLDSLIADPNMGIIGVHVFTFNQVAETEAWRESLRAR